MFSVEDEESEVEREEMLDYIEILDDVRATICFFKKGWTIMLNNLGRN